MVIDTREQPINIKDLTIPKERGGGKLPREYLGPHEYKKLVEYFQNGIDTTDARFGDRFLFINALSSLKFFAPEQFSRIRMDTNTKERLSGSVVAGIRTNEIAGTGPELPHPTSPDGYHILASGITVLPEYKDRFEIKPFIKDLSFYMDDATYQHTWQHELMQTMAVLKIMYPDTPPELNTTARESIPQLMTFSYQQFMKNVDHPWGSISSYAHYLELASSLRILMPEAREVWSKQGQILHEIAVQLPKCNEVIRNWDSKELHEEGKGFFLPDNVNNALSVLASASILMADSVTVTDTGLHLTMPEQKPMQRISIPEPRKF